MAENSGGLTTAKGLLENAMNQARREQGRVHELPDPEPDACVIIGSVRMMQGNYHTGAACFNKAKMDIPPELLVACAAKSIQSSVPAAFTSGVLDMAQAGGIDPRIIASMRF